MQTNYHKNKILSKDKLLSQISKSKSVNQKIAFTNGCFDILHTGHIYLLYKASTLADIVVVGVNSDKSVSRLKGRGRPIMSQNDRAEIIASIRYVDFVTIFDELTPINLVKTIKPDFLIKGGDWKESEIIGADFVKSIGGKVISNFYLPNRSSSNIISSIKDIN